MYLVEKSTIVMELISNTNPILRRKSKPVSNIEWRDRLGPIVPRMRKLCKELEGLGLSAPQVGISIRLFVTEIKGVPIAINPRIVSVSPKTVSKSEGCLTWPGQTRFKKRHSWILAEWTDGSGKLKTKRLNGLDARIFQHELDHLDGICLF